MTGPAFSPSLEFTSWIRGSHLVSLSLSISGSIWQDLGFRERGDQVSLSLSLSLLCVHASNGSKKEGDQWQRRRKGKEFHKQKSIISSQLMVVSWVCNFVPAVRVAADLLSVILLLSFTHS